MSKHKQREISRQHESRKLYKQGVKDRSLGREFRWHNHPHLCAYRAGYNRSPDLPRASGLTELQNELLKVINDQSVRVHMPRRIGKLMGRKAQIIVFDDPLKP